MIGFATVLAACLLIGCAVPPRRLAEGSREFALVGAVLAGVGVLHLWLGALSLVGLTWSLTSVGLPAALVSLAGGVRLAALWRSQRWRRFGWGDALAVTAIAPFAWLALQLRIVFSDFFHHWGAKGQQFFLAQAIDYEYLAAPWNRQISGWYPTALPELFASSSLAQGEFSERAAMAWSIVWTIALVVAAREAFIRAGVAPATRHALVAAVAAVVAGYGIELRLAGGADLMIAAGVAVAAVALLEPPARSGLLPVAIAGAFLASCKVEGVFLAATILAVDQLRRRRAGVFSWSAAAAQAAPATLVVVLWLVQNASHGLRGPGSLGVPDFARLLQVGRALGAELVRQPLFGFPWLLFTIPLALAMRASRWVGLVALAACGFYFWVYAAAAADPNEYVRTTFHRLLVQVIPALFVATAVALAGTFREGQERAG